MANSGKTRSWSLKISWRYPRCQRITTYRSKKIRGYNFCTSHTCLEPCSLLWGKGIKAALIFKLLFGVVMIYSMPREIVNLWANLEANDFTIVFRIFSSKRFHTSHRIEYSRICDGSPMLNLDLPNMYNFCQNWCFFFRWKGRSCPRLEVRGLPFYIVIYISPNKTCQFEGFQWTNHPCLCSYCSIITSELHYTPLKFNSSPLKNDGWKTILSFSGPCNFSEVNSLGKTSGLKTHTLKPPILWILQPWLGGFQPWLGGFP